jgi:hypothetical protein
MIGASACDTLLQTLVSPQITGGQLVLADFTFLDLFWSMLVFFVWVAWFMLLFRIIGDIFRRRDIGGGSKTVWLIFALFLPFLGVFAYLLSNSDGMAQRELERAAAAQAQYNEYLRSAAAAAPPPPA